MAIKIKRIKIESFKGIQSAEYALPDVAQFVGMNGTGKTTIADAHFWLWADKDYDLNSNPEVHPDFLEESVPSVTEVLDIDGAVVEVRKIQQDARTKKQKLEGKPISIKNTYEINGVPKSQTDFVADMEARGVDFGKFLLLSHPEIFTSQKSADCRSILFGMVSDVTDLSIAESLGNCPEAAEQLKNFTYEEVMAQAKRTKKEADAQLDAIPNIIVGMEKSKPRVDVEALSALRASVQAEIDDLKARAEELPPTNEEAIREAIVASERAMERMETEANIDRLTALNIANNALAEVEDEKRILDQKISQKKSTIEEFLRERDAYEKHFDALKAEFQDISKKVFVAENCAYCGQPLPEAKVGELRLAFEQKQAEEKSDINHKAKKVQDRIKSAEDAVHDLSAEVKKLMSQRDVASAKLKEAQEKRSLYVVPVDVSTKPEYKRHQANIAKLNMDLANVEKTAAAIWEINDKLVKKGHEMKTLNDEIAQAAVDERIDAEIAEQRKLQKEYAQKQADAERILYQLSQISMQKNELLTEQVNSHFRRVKFRLFRYQKNGEVKDDCTPMVLTADGQYRDMNYSANTAAILLAQLDIIHGLSEFYGQRYPVFVDGAESLDEKSMRSIETDNQMIYLRVTDDHKTLTLKGEEE